MSFYSQERVACGVRVRAHASVREGALDEAIRRVRQLLVDAPAVQRNLERAGAELHIVAESQEVTDLPMYRHMRGVPFDGYPTMDARARGYGGLHACTAEEALLGLPSARHADHRDVCSHELAHQVFDFGLDEALRDAVFDRFHESQERWAGTYAGTCVEEYFAELTMWHVGSRGDFGTLKDPRPGRAWLTAHDPESAALLLAVYGGELAPESVHWHPVAEGQGRSRSGAPTRILFVNRTDRMVERHWVDFRGEARRYEPVPPEGAVLQRTYATHVWELRVDGAPSGSFVAGELPGRIEIGARQT